MERKQEELTPEELARLILAGGEDVSDDAIEALLAEAGIDLDEEEE